ncbi:hypothetical protein LguiB_018093 [Lonicera macranthoides]
MARNSFILFLLISSLTFCLSIDDKFALLALKTNIIDYSGILSNNWSATSNASICSWIGVSCDLNNQTVTALNLSGMGLAGTFPPVIGNLSFLTSLDISYNNFNSSVPKELSHLHDLQHLLLFNNSFTGTIPASLGNLTKLESLNLRFNQLTGSVPDVIFNICSLRVIDLSSNDLYGSLPLDVCSHYVPKLERIYLPFNLFEGRIPSNLYKCKELQYLSLAFNEFTGSIPIEIGNLTRLKHLYLGYNNLEGEIPVEIGNLKLLERLIIRNSSLEGSIPNSIFNMSSLEIIDLRENNLTGSLPMDIHYNLPVLQELYLDKNQLTGQIPSSLWECRGLQLLSLADNKLIGSISKNIGNLTSLKNLHLSDNNLTGTLPSEIGNLDLQILFLDGNSLSGRIPFEIFNISTIIDIALSMNQFSGPLPSSIGLWIPNLQRLYLGRNRLSGSFPNSISNASKLTMIEMSSNSFTGFIPNTLGNLRDLEWLMIGENNLTGEVSTPELRFFNSLTNCKNLKMLSISLNQFNGILPASITNLSTSLRMFEAFGCKIKGEIPIGIGNLSSLTNLVLDSNELMGFIPSTIGRLENLERLYLEHNDLQGSIPNDLCRLERMGDLYLSHNKLSGPIPSCLGELRTMRRLFLDSNNLTLTIPPTLWSLEDLLYLNLSTNFLSGNIPSDIGNLNLITLMDFSLNQFSGVIPSTIANGQMLTFLSLAHNKLQGSIPQSLGNLVSLELLDLSINNLSRPIPMSLERLRYLQYFNASFNRLQGKIPTGGHFANFTSLSFMQNDGLCGVPRLQVQPCKSRTFQRSRSRILSLLKYILPPIIAMILVVALIFVLMRHRKRGAELRTQMSSLPHAWRRFSYVELLQATNGFSESNLLGVGGIGSVYKGILSDEVNVAVKVFNLQLDEAFKSFDVECGVLRNIRHRNLTKIVSSCSNPDFIALVLEYMPNGSLEKWLYSHNCCLNILERLNIMIDVASALEYLHHGQTTPILHCDLKPSNVLLDKDMIAHVCDFGIAKLLGEDEFMAQTKTLATIRYMAPEYGREGIVSTKGDVYSYGILLMETFTRKKPTNEMFSDILTMRSWVYEASLGPIVQVVDAHLIGRGDEDFLAKKECATSILHLALDCSTNIPTQRISMEDVVSKWSIAMS